MAARFTTAALVSALAVGAAAASGAPARATQFAPGDRAFVREAAQAGMEEEALGRAAEDRAAAAGVRDFASRMVDDHAQADARLRALAQREGVALPGELDGRAANTLAELAAVHGAQFDARYMAHQVSDHRKVIASFEREAAHGRDPELRRFATDALPTLRAHLALAQATERQLPDADRAALRDVRGLDAARQATGASRVAAEENERTTVEETGM